LQPEAQLQIDGFMETLADAPRRLLMLDYDGTIAPFHKERDQAYPYPAIAAALQEIVRDGRTRVVIISGRDVNDLSRRLGIHPIPELWGLYGMQRRRTDGTIETEHVEESYLDALSEADGWLEYQQLRKFAEAKKGSMALHWRGLSERKVEEMRARALLGWEPIADRSGLRLLEFDGGVEIRVPGTDKGDVVRLLATEEGAGLASAYLGDDASDESAFLALGHSGITVLVRPQLRQTAARLWLKPPDEVLDFLRKWQFVSRRNNRGRSSTTALGINA